MLTVQVVDHSPTIRGSRRSGPGDNNLKNAVSRSSLIQELCSLCGDTVGRTARLYRYLHSGYNGMVANDFPYIRTKMMGFIGLTESGADFRRKC